VLLSVCVWDTPHTHCLAPCYPHPSCSLHTWLAACQACMRICPCYRLAFHPLYVCSCVWTLESAGLCAHTWHSKPCGLRA
jgi:hypothetical protein